MTDDAAQVPAYMPVVELSSEPDWVLASLTEAINRSGPDAFLPIRLFLGGAVLSGMLVSGETFFLGVANEIVKSGGTDTSGVVDLFRTFSAGYSPDEASEDDQTVYLHLKDAHLYAPVGSPLIVGYWRGRLSQVAGWAYGVYTQSSNR